MSTPRLSKYLRGIHCFACETSHDPRTLLGVCQRCGMPLRVDYDLGAIRLTLSDLASRQPTLWRYRELLPLEEGDEVALGEGFTPLLAVEPNVWVKDEARNPTGSFKARGMALAVSMAKHLGAKKLSAPSAGNAAGALAAYGARAGLPVIVAMPDDTPKPFFDECELYGATIHRVQGTIADAGKFLREHGPKDAYDVSTLREPYRIEGKKTMAYELVEQLGGAGAGRRAVSDGRRHRSGRHVEGIRRDGSARLDTARQAAALRFRAGRRLCAGREGVPRGRRAHRGMGQRADARLRFAGAFAARRFHLPARVARNTWHGHRDRRRGDAARDSRARFAFRDRRVSGRRRGVGSAGAAAQERVHSPGGQRVIVFNTGTGLKYR